MRSVFAIQLEIRPADGETPSVCLARLRDAVSNWVVDRLSAKWGASSPVLVFDGAGREPLPGHMVKATADQADAVEIAEVTWTHPHDGGSTWVSHCTVARSADTIAFAMNLRLQSHEFDLRPLTFHLGRPAVVDIIVQQFRCSVSGIPVQTAARVINDDDVDDLVSGLLLSPERRIPVVAVSVDGSTDRALVNPDDLQRSVLGFASVVLLKDKWAAFRLTDAVGKTLSCYNGAVRMYWPGLMLTSDPFDHPLFLPGRLFAPGRSIAHDLFRFLNSIASFRFRESKPIADARAIVATRRAQELDEGREAVARGGLDAAEMEKALERAWDEETRLRSALAERDAQLSELTDQLDAQKQVWAAMRDEAQTAPRAPTQIEAKATSGFESVAQAIAAARRDFCGPGKPLLLLERVEKTAAESPYKQPDKVYQVLKALSDIGEKWKTNKGAVGRDGWQGALEHEGFIYKPSISQTTRSKWGDEYTFKYNGEKLLFEEHVTLGAGDPNTCASVHWILDKKNWIVVVGHCGRHLRNTRT